ncbi:hypothetical protein PLICRDRAFT_175676 [Plicaturopsis crispa FD-325 SS-3]|nr:hypothetical protein PLICRDRAFT_175676 [Plicaturopsis crispa FD-325 SS-3]
MKVMVTFNVQTDLDVANGSRGEIVDIILDEGEESYTPDAPRIVLRRPPLYILVELDRTKASALEGLGDGILPIVPMKKTFMVTEIDTKMSKTVTRYQFPVTLAYAFTDYRSQGQTLEYVVIDIARPPAGELTPFNAYVALSRGRGRENIRLLRDFDDRLFTQHPSEHLRLEDRRLEELDAKTEKWWSARNSRDMVLQ